MNVELIGILGIAVLILFLCFGMWLGPAMALTGFLGLLVITGYDGAARIMGSIAYTNIAIYPISALPFFVLMGIVVGSAGIGSDLYKTAHRWFGRLPGGLAISTILACGGFAAITGSSSASIVTMGTVALPEMEKFGYDRRLSTGTIAAGGTLGILIPPSIGFILYAILTEESVGRLFMAGIIPGIAQVIFYVLTIFLICRINPALGPRGDKAALKEKIASLQNTWPVLTLFFLVIGSIYGGICTPTEAAAIGSFGAMVIILIMRRMNLIGLLRGIKETVKLTGMLFILVLGAFVLSHFLALSQLPFLLSDLAANVAVSKYLIFILILCIYIILGMFLEIFSCILLTVPILYPTIMALGFDSIWFGVIMVRIIEIGLITPPIGMNVFMLAGVSNAPLSTIFRGIAPFLCADFLHLALLVAIPQISLYLPNTMF